MSKGSGLTGLLQRAGRRLRHLSDDDLLTVIESRGWAPHLDSCERCALRHAELLCAFAQIDAIHRDADAAFDDERLLHQRTHILRRLDRNNGPARVLPFPAAAEGSGAMRAIGRRWAAAAAIGGVLVGIFSGRLLTHRTDDPGEILRQARTVTTVPRPAASGAVVAADLRPGRDEVLLAEVESAIASPHVSELSAIDAFTPAAR